ncbi:sperm flagellar protein 2-like [Rhodnius prolixus]|uniref:sperm flagellar protein 2-like n=1 Tax=Rhodnius prolixus TaxID=13249 RepID=UPI003D188C88
MASCLERWLQKRLGVHVKLDKETAGELLYDGQIFFNLLKSYNFVTDCQKFDKPKDSLAALQKLREMAIWLKIIGVTPDDMVLRKIANKDAMQSLRLLYELFVALENNDQSNIIYKTRALKTLSEGVSRFSLESSKLSELEKQQPQKEQFQGPSDYSCNQLSADDYNEIAKLYKERQDQIRENSILECFRRRKSAKSRLTVRFEMETEGSPQKDYAAKSQIGSPKAITLETTEGVISCTPSEYVYLLKLWRRKSYENEMRNMKTQSKLLNLLWQHMINSQTDEFHEAFCDKLLQQSTFEKNLALRLNRIHHNYCLFRENTEIIKDQLAKGSPEEFEQTYRVLHDTNDESFEEMRRIYELHRRLYDERVMRKRERIFDLCKLTTKDLINYALKYIQYKEMFGDEVPRNIANEWKDLFFKGICEQKNVEISDIFNLIDKEEELEDVRLKVDASSMSVELEEEEEEEEKLSKISLDVDCEEILNTKNLHNYMYLTGPWFVETLIPDLVELEPSLMITGYIIHRLLETKYPLPPPPPVADVTAYSTRAVLTPFNEPSILKKLKGLLIDNKIAIIDMPKVTNYCIEIYKREKSVSKIGLVLKEKTEEVIKSKEKQTKRDKKKKKDKKDAKEKTKKKTIVEWTAEKAIQVPSEIELSKSTHSRAGLLGKLAFEVLHGGKKLTDIHLIQMLIEFIKGLEDINGWVLINYPMSFQQAAMLEFIFAGIQVHLPSYITDAGNSDEFQETAFFDSTTITAFEDLLEELRNYTQKPEKAIQLGEEIMGEGEEIDEHLEEEMAGEIDSTYSSTIEERSFKEILELRTSKILPRPNKISYSAEPKSYFTKFINLFRIKSMKAKYFSLHEFALTPDTKHDPFIYYSYVGNGVKMPFKAVDFKLINKIAKIILNESESDTESYKDKSNVSQSSLYGNLSLSTIMSAGDLQVTDDVTASLRKSRMFGTQQMMLHSESASKFNKNCVDKSVSSFDRCFQEELWASVNEEELGEEPRLIFPGDPDWIYCEFPVPVTLQKSLATIWEAIEYIYLNNLKELFQLFRKYNATLIPYKCFIRKTCEQSLNPPDNRQTVVTDFQLMFNNVADELRSNNDMKCELHCRVYEMFNELCEISDRRKRYAEDTRRGIISQNWVAQQAYSLINISINLIQVELDRYVDTLQILYDYHIASLQKLPQEKKFDKVTLQKVKYPEGGGRATGKEQTFGRKKTSATKPTKQIKGMRAQAKSNLRYSVPYGIELILLNDEVGIQPNPTHMLVADCVNNALKHVENIKVHYDQLIKDEYKSALQAQILENLPEEESEDYLVGEIRDIKKLPEAVKNNERETKGKLNQKKTSDKISKILKINQSSLFSDVAKKAKKHEGKKKEAAHPPLDFIHGPLQGPTRNLLWEWQRAVQNETDRFLFRLRLIEKRTEVDLDELMFFMKDVFHDYTKEITSRYLREIKNIHLLINLFKVAIEEEQVVRPLIVLDQDEFFIDSYTILHPEIPPPPPSPVNEPSFDFVFSVQQLTNIMEKLNYAAPNGIIEDSFVTILEDMTIFGSECGDPYMPKGWTRLAISDIRKIVSLLFRETMVINWKEFLILGLNLSFPTVQQLLDARNQMLKFDPEAMELISMDDFQKVTLWFENTLAETLELELRIVLIKEFLFNLFKINKHEMNYAAMLMTFCRGETDVAGFVKALTLARGKPYIETCRELYKCEDDAYMIAPFMAEYIINQLLHDVMIITEGIYIREITSDITFDDKFDWYFNQQELAHEKMMEKIKEMKDPIELKEMKNDVENSFWVSLVPFDMALSLIIYYLNYHPLSEEHINRTFRLTDELKKLYQNKGRWNVIRVFDLVESDLMKKVFSVTGSFKAYNLGKLVEKIIGSKRPSVYNT